MALPGPTATGVNQHAAHELFVRYRTKTCDDAGWLTMDMGGYELRYPAFYDDPDMIPEFVTERYSPFFQRLFHLALKARHAWAMLQDYMDHCDRTREYVRAQLMRCEDYRCEVRRHGGGWGSLWLRAKAQQGVGCVFLQVGAAQG